jgi:Flp pilus assembly protein TadG
VTALRRLAGLGRDKSGATIIEFAMILPTMCMLLMAAFDLGYRAYAASVVQGALHEAGRMATVGGISQSQIDARVRARLSDFARRSTIEIRTQSYQEFTGVSQPEPFTVDNAPFNVVNSGDCWKDFVPNGTRDTDRGRAGLGAADDVVRYEITMSYQALVPVRSMLGWSDTETIRANTILRNQPYAARTLGVAIACAS